MLAVLGRSWGLCWRSWAVLGHSWGTLGALLGESWALLGAVGVLYKVYFLHGFYDTALTFVSRLAGRVEEYLDATFDELTEGTHRLFFALTLVMSFMVFAGGFDLSVRSPSPVV